MKKILFICISVIFFAISNGITIPNYYYLESDTIYSDGSNSINTKIYYQLDKSLVVINNIKYQLNFCEKNNETIIKYTNSNCNITCMKGKGINNDMCGSCSSYKEFYWLSISTHIGTCENNIGNLYKYVIDDNVFVEYCFIDKIPSYIKITRYDLIIYQKIKKWEIIKKDLKIPQICINN